VASDPDLPWPDPRARNEAWRAEVEERAVLEAVVPEATTPEAVAPEAVTAPTGRSVVRPPASRYDAAGVDSMLPGRREDAAMRRDTTTE
jgi:hypothetical protein